MNVFFVFLSLIAATSGKPVESSDSESSGESSVVKINEENHKEYLVDSSGPVFVRYFASWCGSCKSFTSSWQKVGDELRDLVKVVDVDCATHNKLCNRFGVKNYPTFQFLDNGEMKKSIRQKHSAKNLIKFAKQMLEKNTSSRAKRDVSDQNGKIAEIYEKDFQPLIENEMALLTFCVPWCSHCRSILDTMYELERETLDDGLKVKWIDCSNEENGNICFLNLNNGVPMVNFYCKGQLMVKDYHGATVKDLKTMVAGNCGPNSDPARWKIEEKERKKKRKDEN